MDKRLLKKLWIMVLLTVMTTACRNYETYADQKEKERNAVSDFKKEMNINEISEEQFHAQGDSTSLEENEYVYLNNSGVYMQIVRKGHGRPIQDGENATLYVRFMEVNIFNSTFITNQNDPFDPDVMTIQRTGTTYTASFRSGLMASNYGGSVPAGWLVPFNYIRVDPPSETEDIAKVRLIVPHTQGHSVASSNVYPYYYEITFQR